MRVKSIQGQQPLNGASWHSQRSAGGLRPQHVARPKWAGAFLNLSTSYAAADRDGPRSGGGGFKHAPGFERLENAPDRSRVAQV